MMSESTRQASVPEEDRIRHLARQLVQSKQLPCDAPVADSVGPSSGATCAVCLGAILEPCIEHTVVFAPSPPGSEPRVLHFHAFCLHRWEEECIAARSGAS